MLLYKARVPNGSANAHQFFEIKINIATLPILNLHKSICPILNFQVSMSISEIQKTWKPDTECEFNVQ